MEPTKSEQIRGRPVQDAADQVTATAAAAQAMLAELRRGWLWQLLIRPPRQDSQGPKTAAAWEREHFNNPPEQDLGI